MNELSWRLRGSGARSSLGGDPVSRGMIFIGKLKASDWKAETLLMSVGVPQPCSLGIGGKPPLPHPRECVQGKGGEISTTWGSLAGLSLDLPRGDCGWRADDRRQ